MASNILKIDLVSQSFMRNPCPTWSRLREAGPVLRVKLPLIGTSWVTTTHEAANQVLKDDETFVREPAKAGRRQLPGMRWWMPPIFRVLAENMLQHDNPDHRRLRRLVDQAFSRHSVEEVRGRIGVICDGLLEGLADEFDLMTHFARPLPLAVICELLGLPNEDRLKFSGWVKAIMSITSLWGILTAVPNLRRVMRYFRSHFEEYRRRPRPGLVSALVQAEQDGDKLSENELLAMAFLLLVGGIETTVHLVGGGTLALLQCPEQKARLLADWSVVPAAVEELLRFVSPVQISKPRYVARDVEMDGQSLKRGDLIVPMLAAANSDPARFESPEALDLARTPNPHLTFGSGMHFCLGAQLARVEAQVAFEKLFTRFSDMSLAVGEPVYVGRFGMRALRELPVRVV